MRFFAVLAAIALAASPAAADGHRGKPAAPVAMVLTSRTAEDGTTVVVLDAAVTRAVPALELRLGDRIARFGATRAGEHHRLELTLAVPADGMDVIASARTGSGARIRAKVASVRVGPAAPERPVQVRRAFGRSIAEVRP
jgi:hypothetical protein